MFAASVAAQVPTDTSMLTKSSTAVAVTHRTIDIRVDYDRFTDNLVKLLGRYTSAGADNLLKNPDLATSNYKSMEGEQGLILFGTIQHGNLMNLGGSPRKGKRYYIGNPLVAYQMMSKDFRAGLYAPLSVLIHEPSPGNVRIEYDLPSTLVGQFGNADVNVVGEMLDTKLESLFAKSAQVAAQ